jgi:hypothetical protein
LRPDVTRVGAVHERPSVEVATTTLFAVHPGSKRQSSHVTQTRPDGSTSAEGSGKNRNPRIVRRSISATMVGGAKVAPPSTETDAPMRRPDQR